MEKAGTQRENPSSVIQQFDAVEETLAHNHQQSNTWLDRIPWNDLRLIQGVPTIVFSHVDEDEFEKGCERNQCAFCADLLDDAFVTEDSDVVLELMSESKGHAIGAPSFEEAVRDQLEQKGVAFNEWLMETGSPLIKRKGKTNGGMRPKALRFTNSGPTIVIEFGDSQPLFSDGSKIGVVDKARSWVDKSADPQALPRLAVAIKAWRSQGMMECHVFRRVDHGDPVQYGDSVLITRIDSPGQTIVKLPVVDLYFSASIPPQLIGLQDLQVDLHEIFHDYFLK